MTRCQSYNAIDIKDEITLPSLSYVLQTPHFTVTCSNFACATGTATKDHHDFLNAEFKDIL